MRQEDVLSFILFQFFKMGKLAIYTKLNVQQVPSVYFTIYVLQYRERNAALQA